MHTAVVDYEGGNLRSVETALRAVGASFEITSEPDRVLAADKVVFPGVGDAKAAMEVLNRSGLSDALRDFFATGKPMLGICVGSQIVLDASEERDAVGLGIVPGTAKRFPNRPGLKVPHMGWNDVAYPDEGNVLFAGIPQNSSFYFVHSYYPDPTDRNSGIGWTDYGVHFCAALSWQNLWATQFHPEKSGRFGLKLLTNFLAL
ncbi:MAG: imidazole glycerol phosphate synthase subunit HisH [bacterium]